MVEEIKDPIARAWALAWSPPDRRMNYEWASAEVVLEGDYATTGRFAIRESTYLVMPFECLGNDVTRMLNVLKAPRTGGSLLGDVWLQDVFKNRPGPFLATMQTDDDAERYYITKSKKTFEATAANAELFAKLEKKRDLYMFPHMSLSFQGANINTLQGKPAKYEWNSEVWLWKAGMMSQAFSRTEDFKRVCKILNESQGGDAGSEWQITFDQGKRHDYGVRCFSCKRLQPYEFFATMRDPHTNEEIRDERGKPIRAGAVWDNTARTPDGRWDIGRAAETTRFRCCYCGAEHVDEARSYEKFAASAGYVCKDPDRRMVDVSCRWNAMVGGDWWRLTKKFLLACEVRDSSGSTVALENFHKKDNASFWDASLAERKVVVSTSDYLMESLLASDYRGREPFDWEDKLFVVADYQDGTGNDTRHLLVGVRAWSDTTHNRSRLIWWGRVNTFADLYRLQRALKVPETCVCVDGSFQMMEVAAQCAKYGWTMLIGDDPEWFLHKRKKGPPLRRPFSPLFKTDPFKGKIGAGRSFCWTMRWSNPAIKGLLWNLRHGHSGHKWEQPADIPIDYRDGIDSEVKRMTAKKGSPVPVLAWVQTKKNNHPWDVECMQTLLAVVTGCLTFDVEEEQPPPPPCAATAAKKPHTPSAPHHEPDQLELLPT